MSSPIRVALYQRLASDEALANLLSLPTAIHHAVAPQSAAFPVIVFHRQSGTPTHSFTGPAIEWGIWLAKGVDRAESASRAEDIAARIDAVLTRSPLVIGTGLVQLWRDSDVSYSEVDGADQYQHEGALYRLCAQPI